MASRPPLTAKMLTVGPSATNPSSVRSERLAVAGAAGLERREHRVEVDPGRLGRVRYRVRPHPPPGRDLERDPGLLGLTAEVGIPRKRDDGDLERAPAGNDAEIAVAVEGDGTDVALREAVDRHDVEDSRPQLLQRVRQLHVEDLRRVPEALEVVTEPEHGRALGGLVGPHALEDAGAVVEAVRGEVDRGVGPVDELAVAPDLLGRLHRRPSSSPASEASRSRSAAVACSSTRSCSRSRTTP